MLSLSLGRRRKGWPGWRRELDSLELKILSRQFKDLKAILLQLWPTIRTIFWQPNTCTFTYTFFLFANTIIRPSNSFQKFWTFTKMKLLLIKPNNMYIYITTSLNWPYFVSLPQVPLSLHECVYTKVQKITNLKGVHNVTQFSQRDN